MSTRPDFDTMTDAELAAYQYSYREDPLGDEAELEEIEVDIAHPLSVDVVPVTSGRSRRDPGGCRASRDESCRIGREQAVKRIVAFVAAVVAVTGFTMPRMASATTLIVCVASQTTNYDPPLTLELSPTSIHAEANYALCLGGLTSATGKVDGQSPSASCLTVSMPQVAEVVKFNTNQTSRPRVSEMVWIRPAASHSERFSVELSPCPGEPIATTNVFNRLNATTRQVASAWG